ncbi:MAG: hypothetical protein SFY80_11430 [Verrucomicrobiota bacterium]|nr:hypothetical protein [Verrucomicrobiota bacterium]
MYTSSKKRDYKFEIEFYEDVFRRNRNDTVILEALANLYTQVGRVDEGLKLDRKHVRLEPDNPTAYYNLACSLALKKRRTASIEALKTAITLGFTDLDWMQKDPDLKSLHGHPQFAELLRETI